MIVVILNNKYKKQLLIEGCERFMIIDNWPNDIDLLLLPFNFSIEIKFIKYGFLGLSHFWLMEYFITFSHYPLLSLSGGEINH